MVPSIMQMLFCNTQVILMSYIQILVISNIKNGSGFSKFHNPLFFNMLFL